MSIKAIALDLYRAQQTMNRLEKELAEAHLKDHDALRKELQQATLEYRQIRSILDGEKTPSPFRYEISTFKRGR